MKRLAFLAIALSLLVACTKTAPRPGSSGSNTQVSPSSSSTTISDLGPLGSAAKGILAPTPFTSIVVEVDAVSGESPDPSSLAHLTSTLRAVTNKEVTVTTRTIPRNLSNYSADDIRRISKDRARSSGGSTASILILYLNGGLTDSPDALGVAVAGTVAAIFPDQIDRAVTAVVQPGAIERAVLVHELGHLMGLVNIGHTSRADHEDANHTGHSKSTSSVMYWQIEDISVASLLSGGPPDTYDRLDLQDLSDIASS